MAARVEVNQGILEGKKCSTYSGFKYYSFEGIPFAKPPVGELRFRDPQPPESWSGVRDATKPGQKCAQMNPYAKKPLDGSEDCLYLNVYTPMLPEEKLKKLPVLFFVHGGRLLVGYGDYYRPDYFIPHDVILVTTNYRLHILGFLCLNTPDVPGNAALKDVVMALKWVKNNISKFNGDVNNVTLFGESAGGGMASSLLASEMADDLFHKIIIQSSTHLSDLYMDNDDPVSKAKNVASLLGKEFDDVASLYEFLVNVPIDDLLFAVNAAELNRPRTMIAAYFNATIEKRFTNTEQCFTEPLSVVMLQNRYKKMPVLLGVQSHEGALFLQKDEAGNIAYEKDLREFVPRFLLLRNDSDDAAKIAVALEKFYFNGREINDETFPRYVELLNDAYFNRDVILTAELLSKNCKVFAYDFHYNGNLSTRTMKKLNLKGAAHGDLLQYLFYRENKAKNVTEEDMKIVNFLTESWTNFAKSGNPSTRSCNWQPYTQESKLCLKIDKEQKLERYSKWRNIDMWAGIMRQHPTIRNYCKL